jgi:F-type H+-transporting ATPase subunit epsilon
VRNILNLRIYTPQKLFLEETITKLKVSEKGCNYTILPRHIDYLSSFSRSTINFRKLSGEEGYVWLNQGILVKCGREIQISVFSAINGGSSVENLKLMMDNNMKNFRTLIESTKKFKLTLKNIEDKVILIR